MTKLELDHIDTTNLLFCLLYTQGFLDDKMPLKEYRTQLTKWVNQLITDINIQSEFIE